MTEVAIGVLPCGKPGETPEAVEQALRRQLLYEVGSEFVQVDVPAPADLAAHLAALADGRRVLLLQLVPLPEGDGEPECDPYVVFALPLHLVAPNAPIPLHAVPLRVEKGAVERSMRTLEDAVGDLAGARFRAAEDAFERLVALLGSALVQPLLRALDERGIDAPGMDALLLVPGGDLHALARHHEDRVLWAGFPGHDARPPPGAREHGEVRRVHVHGMGERPLVVEGPHLRRAERDALVHAVDLEGAPVRIWFRSRFKLRTDEELQAWLDWGVPAAQDPEGEWLDEVAREEGAEDEVAAAAPSTISSAMLTESALSFLGLGVDIRIPTWGSILSDGRAYLQDAWWIATLPGVALLALMIPICIVM